MADQTEPRTSPSLVDGRLKLASSADGTEIESILDDATSTTTAIRDLSLDLPFLTPSLESKIVRLIETSEELVVLQFKGYDGYLSDRNAETNKANRLIQAATKSRSLRKLHLSSCEPSHETMMELFTSGKFEQLDDILIRRRAVFLAKPNTPDFGDRVVHPAAFDAGGIFGDFFMGSNANGVHINLSSSQVSAMVGMFSGRITAMQLFVYGRNVATAVAHVVELVASAPLLCN